MTDAADIAPYVTEERDLFHGRSPLVLRPGSTAEVSAICKLASEHKIALVPQGGNTGLVGGQTPHHGEVVVSLRRLDKIREIDPASNTMTCEAGVVLQIAQARGRSRPPVPAVARRGRKLHHRRQSLHQRRRHRGLGVWRGARNGARARGCARGWTDPERIVKTEEGQYRLRFAQPLHRRRGTLGIITAATLKLFPKPRAVETAYVGLKSPAEALKLLSISQNEAAGSLTSFELLADIAVDFSLRHGIDIRDPLRASIPGTC